MTRKAKPKKLVPIRNWVAKHAQESGAGRHKDDKKDYKRKPKHQPKGENHE
ncbi:MAG: hypothetical protein KBC21_02325 [Candidatus Pacebacteria bacterium]|nr:hypothetical protein [Candidatus Paceibacterota bacterium]